MAPLHHYPPHIRKKIVLGGTVGVAVVLLVVFIVLYTHMPKEKGSGSGSQLSNFYNTILDDAQSYFIPK
jgi:hypothetical protein